MILILSSFPAFPAVYTILTGLQGDMAVSSGPLWPTKKWFYHDELKNELKPGGLKANMSDGCAEV